MNIDELYKAKGQLVTQIEVSQAKLQQVNQQIIKILNEVPKEVISNDEVVEAS